MRSDLVHITSAGAGMTEALDQTEATAVFKKLSPKNALHLRLLAEEMLGMFRAITGEAKADFWIEDEEGLFRLHLCTDLGLDPEAKEKLISVSTSGKNAAEKTFMGKLCGIFLRAATSGVDSMYGVYDSGWYIPGASGGMSDIASMETQCWSLNQYRASLPKKQKGPASEWDELERSVVASLADDVEVFIRGSRTEMVISKKFA